ncbi:hypothetical protein GALL_496190 [mine drainage metagenome]|uniref:Uncharacterized protein n=1 Tax=mine drainage metagenome TaxID=410659 RepID=A0A1J5PDE4_9ZZZZ
MKVKNVKISIADPTTDPGRSQGAELDSGHSTVEWHCDRPASIHKPIGPLNVF